MPLTDAQVQECKRQIAEDKLIKCLDELMEASAGLPAHLSNQVISLNARLHGVARENRLGVLRSEEVQRRRATIRLQLLELLPLLRAAEEAPAGESSQEDATATPASTPASSGVAVFISWSSSDEDRPFKTDLDKQLILLRRSGEISLWDRSQVAAGADVEQVAQEHLRTARVFLVLLSQDYFYSDACFAELEVIQQQRSNRSARVIPILIRPCQYDLLPIGRLQILPRDGVPIAEQPYPDSAWASIVREVHALVESL